MKKHYESTVKGEGTSYSAPSVEILSISIEKGFANSTVLDYGGAGEAGGSVNDTDYGILTNTSYDYENFFQIHFGCRSVCISVRSLFQRRHGFRPVERS